MIEMLAVNTMAYGCDEFKFCRQALLKARAPLDFTYETSCSGFEINGTEPEGCKRRVVFLIDEQLYKFGNGGLTEYEFRGELNDILAEGNTVAELLAVDNVPEFIGKKVFVWIALDAPADSPVMPKIKIAAKVNSFNDIYTKFAYSPVYSLPLNSKIKKIREDKILNGNGSATNQAKIFNPVNKTWSDFDFLPNFENKSASKIQFRTQYILTALDGSDFAKVNFIKCAYSTDSSRLSGSTCEIVSLPQDFPQDLKTCYALIKHSELIDSQIKAFVNFSAPPVRRENIMIGTATGDLQTLYLMCGGVVDTGILQDTLHLDIGGRTFSDFDFDTENSTITLKADAGAEIFASYECCENENWLEMEPDSVSFSDGIYFSKFKYRLTDSRNKKIAAVKFVITRLADKVEQTVIGAGNGKIQKFALPHKAKIDTLNASGAWKYDENTQILQTITALNEPVTAAYEYQGDFPQIFEYIWGVSAV